MKRSMTQGSPIKAILFFTIPLLIGNLFQQFYNMADTLIVGRTIGVPALAAVGCTGSLTFLILGFVIGFTNGSSIITAQRFGAEDMDGVKKSFAAGIVLNAALAVIMTILGVLIVRPLLKLLNTPEDIIDDAYSYLVVIFAGVGASILFNLLSNTLRAIGDSRTPLVFLIIACVANIIMDFIFILVFKMGVRGVAVATITAQILSGIFCLIFIWKKVYILRLRRKHFKLDMDELKLHLRVSLPMAFQMSIIAIGALILQAAINNLGDEAVVANAAFSAAQKIDSIATMPLQSFGAAMATYSAQNYGAKLYGRIKKGVFQCSIVAIIYSVIMGGINITFGRYFVYLFVGNEPQVLDYAHTFLSLTGMCYFILALLFIFRNTLQGLGKNKIPTLAGIIELLMRAFAAIALTGPLGFTGVSLAGPLAWIGACIPLTVAFVIEITKLTKKTNECNGD